jgi:hypothetical protein
MKSPPDDASTDAQSAFADYKRRMDEQYSAHADKRPMASPPAPPPGFYPMYALGAPPPGYPSMEGTETGPASEPAASGPTGANIVDGMAKLLDLSVRTVNTTLESWLNVMTRFSGRPFEDDYHGDPGCYDFHHAPDYPCDCHHHPHEESCCCGECRPGVHNC